MERVVQGIRFEGKPLPGAYDIRTWSGNGVTEISAKQVIEWQEVGFSLDAPQTAAEIRAELGHGYLGAPTKAQEAEWAAQDAADELERKHRCLKKAAQRAKTMCRRVIITEGFDELLTLTYRANQTNRELCKKHFGIWCKRMKRALGSFRFCASFEMQERGAMHVHVATHRLPKMADYKGSKVKAWQVGTAIWRDIVGEDNGMCFVGGKTKWAKGRRRNMGLAKMASYVSKYIMKDYELAPDESNRYSRSNGTVVAKSEVVRFTGISMCDAIVLAFNCADGDVVVSWRLNAFKDAMWLCTEPGAPPGKLH